MSTATHPHSNTEPPSSPESHDPHPGTGHRGTVAERSGGPVAARPISTRFLTVVRPLARFVLQRHWSITIEGADRVPRTGAALLATNHIGVLDGPLAVAMAPRPTVALAKAELFRGPVGRVLASCGQIPIERQHTDVAAIRRCTQLLEQGHALTIFPEGRRATGDMTVLRGGLVYLAMVTGAPIIPVTLLGTRLPGQTAKQLAGRGARIHLEYGEPITDVPRVDWPRTQADVRDWTARVSQVLTAEVRRVELAAGLRLPGEPLPHLEQPIA